MIDRRRFLHLAAVGGGAVFASALPGSLRAAGYEEFFFVQLSDAHWGYSGAAYKELFGETHYSFDHKGVHFVAIDNVSDPGANVGEAQLQWLKADLAKLKKSTPIVVFTHRPLFDLAPAWDWATRDGAKVIDILMPYANVTVFYGHIHQEHHQQTGHIAHHSAKSLIFPLPAPLSQPKRTPLPSDPAQPNKGLGFREVEAEVNDARYKIAEFQVTKA